MKLLNASIAVLTMSVILSMIFYAKGYSSGFQSGYSIGASHKPFVTYGKGK